jgi:hypothetical protein
MMSRSEQRIATVLNPLMVSVRITDARRYYTRPYALFDEKGGLPLLKSLLISRGRLWLALIIAQMQNDAENPRHRAGNRRKCLGGHQYHGEIALPLPVNATGGPIRTNYDLPARTQFQ